MVSRYGVMRGVWSMDTVGPMSRTVEDAAITLGAIAGHDPKDPYSWNTPVPDYLAALDGDVSGMRIGMISEQINSAMVEPEVRDVVLKASTVLGELGATAEEVSIPLSQYASMILFLNLAVEPATTYADEVRQHLDLLGHDPRILLLTGSILPAQAYYKAQKLRSLLTQQVDEALEKYDVLILPTTGKVAQKIEEDPMVTSKATSARLPYLLTRVFPATGGPAVSVPCGFSSGGLPIGLQIGARPGADDTVLKVAHAYEQATPWHTMRPPAA